MRTTSRNHRSRGHVQRELNLYGAGLIRRMEGNGSVMLGSGSVMLGSGSVMLGSGFRDVLKKIKTRLRSYGRDGYNAFKKQKPFLKRTAKSIGIPLLAHMMPMLLMQAQSQIKNPVVRDVVNTVGEKASNAVQKRLAAEAKKNDEATKKTSSLEQGIQKASVDEVSRRLDEIMARRLNRVDGGTISDSQNFF